MNLDFWVKNLFKHFKETFIFNVPQSSHAAVF